MAAKQLVAARQESQVGQPVIKSSQRCRICNCFVDVDDLFCANCGTENHSSNALALLPAKTHTSFQCDSCGASMTYDAQVATLRCPYCGAEAQRQQHEQRFTKPEHRIRFRVSADHAQRIFRDWLGRGFWRPSNLRSAARLGKIAMVYVPYWSFEAETRTQWTADSSPAPSGSRGDWYPVSGQHQGQYCNLLVCGSSVLTPRETQSIAPFEWSSAEPVETDATQDTIVEQFQVPRKLARPQAREMLHSLELTACRKLVPGRARNVRVNVQVSSMIGHPVLLPIWILAYNYRSDVHRVLINGQTGKIAGSAPFSYFKLAIVLGSLLLLIAVLALAAAASG